MSVPRRILDQVGLKRNIDITVRGRALVISGIGKPRSEWSNRFAEMRANGDDALLDSATATFSSWDEKEWEW